MNLPKNPNVQLLAKTMDLDLPKWYLTVSDYHYQDGQIVINKINLFDTNGKFIKFVDNEKVIEHLNKYPIAFEKPK